MAGRDAQVALTPPASPAPRAPRRRASKALAAAARAAADTEPAEHADPARIEALREWRRAEAARRAVPAFVILHDRTLAAVAVARPATLSALAAIPGIGPAKLEAYGQAILELLHGAAS
jgi:superfamily II DNA helicase RecQ